MGTTPIGAVLVGLIIDHVSPRAAVGLGAASAILCGGALLLRATLSDPGDPQSRTG
jgi:hypothetical protein